ncbi:MAG: alanine--tRNA ligase [Chlamydiota bacterium]
MMSQTIRRNFLNFFKEHDHAIVSSSSVVPHDDPTLLFINAGMNQFKDVFLGKSERDYKKAATSQKCIRVGGKHNDLDNVGHTTRHLTFFEMLGNFSFGDYFKAQAIEHAWKVSTEVFTLPEEKIWITIFREDDEAFELWRKIVPESRIIRMDEKDNFWAMGDTGPCGPCSELLFDRGDRYGNARSPKEDLSGERFLEFWNLVFMQFNRDASGIFHPLPKQSIDTGSGLERVAALKLGVDTVFATDIFKSLIAQIENTSSIRYDENNLSTAPAFHVIADHIRSLSFAIADGAQPSNIERGYVLRKILRRAVRYGKNLGLDEPFLAKILPRLVEIMGSDYKELISSQHRIAEVLTLEEEAFLRTLKRGGNILQHVIEKAQNTPLKQIAGEEAFKLKDTYGLPLEEILLIAKDTGLGVNLEAYQLLEEQAKERSRAAEKQTLQESEVSLFKDFTSKHGKCAFVGYDETVSEATILAIIHDGAFVDSLKEGQEGMILLKQTPFYPEKGGQVTDLGTLSHHEAHFVVKDCQTPYPDVIVHIGYVEKGTLIPGEPLIARVDEKRRQKTSNNHTATHLLHAALQKILGPHIRQAGSLVEPSRLRFDFNHHKPVSKQELRDIEKWVNDKIRENYPVTSYELSYEEAQEKKEIKQFFGEKYGARVRVVDINCSQELCGGTHTHNIGTIGFLRVTKEGSIASGVRRIEAVTGEEAEDLLYEQEALLENCCMQLKTNPPLLEEKLRLLLEENKKYALEMKTLKRQSIKALAKDLLEQATLIRGTLFLAKTVPLQLDELSLLAEDLSSNTGSSLFVLATQKSDSCHLFIKVSKELQSKGLLAGALIKEFVPYIEGSGGGKADTAQAAGKKGEGLSKIFSLAKSKLESLC